MLQRTNRMRILFGVGVLVVVGSGLLSLFSGRRRADSAEPSAAEKVTMASLSAAMPSHAPAQAEAEDAKDQKKVAPQVVEAVVGADDDDDGDGSREAQKGPPDGLTRTDVVAALGAVEDRVSACYGGEAAGSVKLTIASSGRVLGAQVSGPLAGTNAGDCVAGAARDAVFRSTRRDATTLVWQLPLHVPGTLQP